MTDDQTNGALRHTPLIEAHRAAGAKLVEFGGWEMPLAYGDGTLAEHRRCRTDAVLFDVSHLGTVRVTGNGSFDRLQRALSNDLRKIEPGRAQYTHLLADDGSVVDDIIVWWVADEVFDVMPNASNTTRVREAIGGVDTTESRAVIAIQGPTARSLLHSLVPDAAAVGRFRVTSFQWEGTECMAAGTGYTGEDGVECALPGPLAESFWHAVVALGVEPAGLGARDTLRLEAGLPLHGHELGPGITPLQANLGWVVGWEKAEFRGKEALMAEREQSPRRTLVGLLCEGRRPPREGSVVSIGGDPTGMVTSGNFSPMLEAGIALAFVDNDGRATLSQPVEIEIRGNSIAGKVTKTPFTQPGQWAGGH